MTRKKWVAQTEVTPIVLKLREKRKWQIALRRYVLEKLPCVEYAPYFGLDIESIRKWFELQFDAHTNWENYGKLWQFEHIIPVAYFDFSNEEELKMCWSFANIRIGLLQEKEIINKFDFSVAKTYFTHLYTKTGLSLCEKMIRKIDLLQNTNLIDAHSQEQFINQNKQYISLLENYSSLEFEMLNRGRSIDDVKKESELLKKFGT